MDINEYAQRSLPYASVPLGGGPLWSMEENLTMRTYDKMTETQKEHLIMRCKDAKSSEQKEKAVEEMAQDMNFRALAEETGMFGDSTDEMH